MRILIIFLLLIFARPSHAEIFQNITPFQTLGEIKNLFPNAKFERIQAAWVTEKDGFYKMSGAGFSGTLFLAFHDSREFARSVVKGTTEKIKETESIEPTEAREESLKTKKALLSLYQAKANQSEDEALTISWLRWVPDSVIPLQRYISKYGMPDKSGFNDSDMTPYRNWMKRGVGLTLTDDEKNVLSAEFAFTAQENLTYCHRKFSLDLHNLYCGDYASQISKSPLTPKK